MEGTPGNEDRPGSELKPGNEPVEGRLGSDVVDGTPGNDDALGSELNPGTELVEGRLGSEGVDGKFGVDGKLGIDGSPGSEVGSAEGAVTHAVPPLALDAVTDPEPAGAVTLPASAAVTGLGIDGMAGVLTHCDEGSECGTANVVRLGTDVGATALWVAPLGNAFAATAATAASPAAPAASRMVRP